MAKKALNKFSIYGHVNSRRRHQFVVHDSPTPTPEPENDSSTTFVQGSSSLPSMDVNMTDVNDNPESDDSPLFVSRAETLSRTALTAQKPSTRSRARKGKAKAAKTKGTVDLTNLSSSEAEEAPAKEEIDLDRRNPRPPRAVRPKRSPSPIVIADESRPKSKSPVLREVYGQEHRSFYLRTKRSLRGRTTTDIILPGAKIHVARSDDYYVLCDTDILFESANGKPSKTADGSTGEHNEQNEWETFHDPPARTRKPKASNRASSSIYSDIELQRDFTQWTEGLIRKNTELSKQTERKTKELDKLRNSVATKDEKNSKLQTELRRLELKAKQVDPRIPVMEEQITILQAEVVSANDRLQKRNTLIDRQNADIKATHGSRMDEKDRYEKQIRELRQQLAAMKSSTFQPLTPPMTMPTPRPYVSALSKAIGRATISPPVPPSRFAALEAVAKEVVAKAEPLMAMDFGGVGAVLQKLKDVLEEDEEGKIAP